MKGNPQPWIDDLSGAINKKAKDDEDATGIDIEMRTNEAGEIIQQTKTNKGTSDVENTRPQREAWCTCDVKYRELTEAEKDDLRDEAREMNYSGTIYHLFMSRCMDEELAPPEVSPISAQTLLDNRSTTEVPAQYEEGEYIDPHMRVGLDNFGVPLIEMYIPSNTLDEKAVSLSLGSFPFDGRWIDIAFPQSYQPEPADLTLRPPEYSTSNPDKTLREVGALVIMKYSNITQSDINNMVSSEAIAGRPWGDSQPAIVNVPNAPATAFVYPYNSTLLLFQGEILDINDALIPLHFLLTDYSNNISGTPPVAYGQGYFTGNLLTDLSSVIDNLPDSKLGGTPEGMGHSMYFPQDTDDSNSAALLFEQGDVALWEAFRPNTAEFAWRELLRDAGLF